MRLIMEKQYFALLTDFGYDFAVAAIKAVIFSHVNNAEIIDLDHSGEKFAIKSAAFVLAKTYNYFPKNTIFLLIVDPGVGTERDALLITTPNYSFVGPNNGIFDLLLKEEKDYEVLKIDNDAYLRGKPITFHGRDLFAPAAADFYLGQLEHFKPFEKEKLVHSINADETFIAYIDSFGNIKTNKRADDSFHYGSKITLHFQNHILTVPYVTTFQDVAPGELLAYQGSNETIEIAINQASAKSLLNVRVGDALRISN